VPFAQMDVRLRSLFGQEGGEALRALKLEAPEERQAEPRPDSVNDAAEDLARPLPEPDDDDEPPTSSRSPGSPAP
jgi:hypothetical protein